MTQILTDHSSWYRSIAFSPGGKTLAVGGYQNGTVTLWDMASGRQVAIPTGHEGQVWSVTFAPDGQTLAAGIGDTTLWLWDVATKKTAEFQQHGPGLVGRVLPNGKLLAAGGLGDGPPGCGTLPPGDW